MTHSTRIYKHSAAGTDWAEMDYSADSDIYICGPAPWASAVPKAAEDLGVPKNRFHDEAFAFHSQ